MKKTKDRTLRSLFCISYSLAVTLCVMLLHRFSHLHRSECCYFVSVGVKIFYRDLLISNGKAHSTDILFLQYSVRVEFYISRSVRVDLLRILPTIISCVVRQQCLSQVARLRYLVVAQALLFISSLTSLQELFNVVTTNNKQPMITSTDTKTFTKSRRTQTQKSKRLHVRVGVAIRDSGVR